jgi:hypothetical protein
MSLLRSLVFALPASAVLLAGCGDTHLLEPKQVAGQRRDAATGSRLATPSGLTAVAVSESQVNVKWQDNSTGETSFEVYRSESGAAGGFILRATVNANLVTYADVGLMPSTEYCFKTRAVRVAGANTTYSDFSNTGCATSLGFLQSASEIRALATDSSTVRVSWRDNSLNEEGFHVYRSRDGGASWVLIATTKDVAIVDSGVQSAEFGVCYNVAPFDSMRETPPAMGCTARPAAPTNVSVTPIDDQTVDLRWTDNSAVEDSYQVWAEVDWYPGCDGAACNAEYYTWIGMVAELPPNTTSYRCTSCAGASLWVYAVKNGIQSSR